MESMRRALPTFITRQRSSCWWARGGGRVVPVGEGGVAGFAAGLFELEGVGFAGGLDVEAAFVEFAFGLQFDHGLAFDLGGLRPW